MKQYWLVVGTQKNWGIAFENKNIWGLREEIRELKGFWNMLREGDGLLFYVSKPVNGVVGFGTVTAKFRQTNPLWPDEVEKGTVIWPLRFEFDIEYCLPPDAWTVRRYTSDSLLAVTRMVFQCYPIEEVNRARKALGLPDAIVSEPILAPQAARTAEKKVVDHDTVKGQLAEIGRIQGYVADEEYPLETTKLDVVWRRVQRSVPTFVFEVQIGGDIYHAMAKLKHAYDLWNSNIFLVASLGDRGKYEELLAGTFHEVSERMKFINVPFVEDLLKRKKDYKNLEHSLGII